METLGLSTLDTPLCFSRPHPVSSMFLSSASFLSNPLSKARASSFPLRLSCTPLSSSLQSPSDFQNIQNSPKTLKAKAPRSSLLKTVSVAVASTALLLAQFQKPSLAVSTPPPTVETKEDSVSDVEKEKALKEYIDSHPDDVSALKALMEVKVKLQKLPEAIDELDRLILLQPEEKEWPLLRGHLYLYSGEVSTAKSIFEELISADRFRVEAYHGLMMAVSQSDPDSLEGYLKRVKETVERCKKERKEDLRDFKLLLAQVQVTQGKYEDALTLYKELVKEDPRDFRPYLCQGIIYALLRKMDEAEKQFEKYRRLVPRGHPYADYFDDNVLATKVFSQMRDNEMPVSKR
ncbi:protein SLOW GREEN 1, chloroplastic-like [Aristolochia californica]|uniref:protein SLOW GREEN 1, chloroplastic-like n=1 Tax=Aristolochia californica TaxID=171875 RepID=UPI0035D73E23